MIFSDSKRYGGMMRAFFNQRGEGKGGLIFGLLVLFVLVYTAIKVVPVMIKVYAYEDAVREECKLLHGVTLSSQTNSEDDFYTS